VAFVVGGFIALGVLMLSGTTGLLHWQMRTVCAAWLVLGC
jgi:hypothetical protein